MDKCPAASAFFCSIETGVFNPTAKLALILCIALDKKFEE